MPLELLLGLVAGGMSAMFGIVVALMAWIGRRFVTQSDKLVAIQQQQTVTQAVMGIKIEELTEDVQELKTAVKQLPNVKYKHTT